VESLKLKLISPCVGYLDEVSGASALARRPATLEGKVLGLVPNWRPAAVHILSAIGALLQERYHLKEVVMEPVVRVSAMAKGGKLLDGIIVRLEELAKRVDFALTATGD
jgi:hypothetical protein